MATNVSVTRSTHRAVAASGVWCAACVVVQVRMLVSTDMASRGLDLPKLTHVLNLHVPSSPRQYLHRAGRVGRQGRSGTVITMATSPAEVEAMRSTATLLGVPLTVVRIKSGKIEPVPAPKA